MHLKTSSIFVINILILNVISLNASDKMHDNTVQQYINEAKAAREEAMVKLAIWGLARNNTAIAIEANFPNKSHGERLHLVLKEEEPFGYDIACVKECVLYFNKADEALQRCQRQQIAPSDDTACYDAIKQLREVTQASQIKN